MAAQQCACGKTTGLRPYGPNGTPICFKCAMKTPESKAETDARFLAQLDAAEAAAGPGGLVAVGCEAGPHVFHRPEPGDA